MHTLMALVVATACRARPAAVGIRATFCTADVVRAMALVVTGAHAAGIGAV